MLTSAAAVESWGHFPRERRRLLALLEETRPRGALLLSGDVHYAELAGAPRAALPPGAELLEVAPEIARDCPRLPEIARDCPRLPEITRGYPRSLEITRDSLALEWRPLMHGPREGVPPRCSISLHMRRAPGAGCVGTLHTRSVPYSSLV